MEDKIVFSFLIIPFCVTIILTGIHVYLGLHVLSRGIIFVDLALAQIAALGVTFSVMFGYEMDNPIVYWWALAFTVVGGLLFAFFRRFSGHIPHEAIIGIVYAVASAGMILAMDKAPHGAEHIKSLLVRDILWVQDWNTVIKIGLIYGGIGILHLLLYPKMKQATFSPETMSNRSLFLIDLFFFISFGIVVTSSVQIAGVLLVFSYLMIPSVIAAIIAKRIWARLAIGWIAGFVFSLMGLLFSFRFDLPTGPTIIVTLGAGLLFVSASFYLFKGLIHK